MTPERSPPRRQPSGRPIVRIPWVRKPVHNIPLDGFLTPRLQAGKSKVDAVGFIVRARSEDEDE